VTERVFEVTFAVSSRDAAKLAALLFEAGAGAVEERDGPKLVVYVTRQEEALRLSQAARAGVSGALEISERELDPSWQTEWMRYLGPVALTERIVLQPTTDASKLPRGKRRLWFEPDQAFGVGSHATTRLTARATERLCRAERPVSVLDVGTGNGVLALVAALSGATRVLGIDIDPTAVRAAKKNARLNRMTERCSFSARKLAGVRSRFGLVLANIEVWVLAELAPDLARVTAADGRLVLSGLLAERGAEVLERFGALGFSEEGREAEDGWLVLVLGRSGVRARPSGQTARKLLRRPPRA
jgi:ribosomal protein L11 methyltransferase